MRLMLIRHAEADFVEAAKESGAPQDKGLTSTGRGQAYALARHLRASRELEDCQAFLSSPLPRAVQTAAILADALALPAVCEEIALSEIGDLPSTPARGEDLAEFFARVHAAMNDLAERFRGKTIAAVTHAGFIWVSISVLFDIPMRGRRARFDPENASLTEWSLSDGIWRLERYNVAPIPPQAQ